MGLISHSVIYIHGLVWDEQNRNLSKSASNGVDPPRLRLVTSQTSFGIPTAAVSKPFQSLPARFVTGHLALMEVISQSRS